MIDDLETVIIDSDDDGDDDIQIIPHKTEEPFVCQFCGIGLSSMTEERRQFHYDDHLDSSEPGMQERRGKRLLKDKPISNGGGPSSHQEVPEKYPKLSPKYNVFWFHSRDKNPPSEFTPSLIPILRHALSRSHSRGNTSRAILCHESVVHVQVGWDRTWGCGYRNFLMACTALIDQDIQPLYFPLLDSPIPPGVRNLQLWLEEAWKAGFDAEGAQELNHHLLGTSKWIGTAELYVAFTSRGIPSRLVDFKGNTERDQLATSVLNWIKAYFNQAAAEMAPRGASTVNDALRGASPVVITKRMPLILQYHGHSRSVIGYETAKNGEISLLIFDPSRHVSSELRKVAVAYYNSTLPPSDQASLVEQNNKPRQRLHTLKHSLKPSNIMNKVLHPHSDSFRDGSSNNEASASSSSKPAPRKRVRRFSSSSAEVVEIPSPTKSKGKAREAKRVRGGLREQFAEVLVIDDNDDDIVEVQHKRVRPITVNKEVETDTRKAVQLSLLNGIDEKTVLSALRLKCTDLRKHDRYQILYFPMTPPLTEQEKLERRTVTCEVAK